MPPTKNLKAYEDSALAASFEASEAMLERAKELAGKMTKAGHIPSDQLVGALMQAMATNFAGLLASQATE